MKVSLINLIDQSTDFNMVAILFKQAKSLEKQSQKSIIDENKPDFREAIVEWQDDDATFEDAIKGQEHKQLTFEDFKELQDDPDWEYSLDELLAALD